MFLPEPQHPSGSLGNSGSVISPVESQVLRWLWNVRVVTRFPVGWCHPPSAAIAWRRLLGVATGHRAQAAMSWTSRSWLGDAGQGRKEGLPASLGWSSWGPDTEETGSKCVHRPELSALGLLASDSLSFFLDVLRGLRLDPQHREEPQLQFRRHNVLMGTTVPKVVWVQPRALPGP